MDHRIDVLNPDRTLFLRNVPLSDMDFSDPDDFEAVRTAVVEGEECQIGSTADVLFVVRPAVPE